MFTKKLFYILLAIAGLIAALIASQVYLFQHYGLTLFVWTPCITGILVGILTPTPTHKFKSFVLALKSIFLLITLAACFGILFVSGFEGLICLLMIIPIYLGGALLGLVISYGIGSLLGEQFRKRILENKHRCILSLSLILLTPLLSGFELSITKLTTTYPVSTEIIINKPCQVVWNNVVTFPELNPPQEWLFKAGIAYPTHATIENVNGQLIRYCHFSTGEFIEPITNWDAPYQLDFDVIDQPVPMTELSFYEIHPPHLDGYFKSIRGQFKLIPIDKNRTILKGTTWYQVNLWPQFYWKLWGDSIIHKIHQRVLNHIKTTAENTSHSIQQSFPLK